MILNTYLSHIKKNAMESSSSWIILAPTFSSPDESLRCLPNMATEWHFVVNENNILTVPNSEISTWLAKHLFPYILVYDFGTHGFETKNWNNLGHSIQNIANTSIHAQVHMTSLINAYTMLNSAHNELTFLSSFNAKKITHQNNLPKTT